MYRNGQFTYQDVEYDYRMHGAKKPEQVNGVTKYRLPGMVDLVRTDEQGNPRFFRSMGDVSFTDILTSRDAQAFSHKP